MQKIHDISADISHTYGHGQLGWLGRGGPFSTPREGVSPQECTRAPGLQRWYGNPTSPHVVDLPNRVGLGHVWALALQGQGEEGMAQLRQGILAWRATGAAQHVPYHLTMLADVSAHLGHVEDGLQALAEAHILVEQHEERYWEAEVCRLRGVLLLRQPGTPQAEAETWLQRALDVARRQEAKFLELRAAMSLARLWQQQGKRHEARELLAPVYGWFTEGFDTADLQEVKALLGELS
jgi:predicted ATPase